ncbi:MAG: alpha-L-fucosidase [Thermoguttaceae bacterium]
MHSTRIPIRHWPRILIVGALLTIGAGARLWAADPPAKPEAAPAGVSDEAWLAWQQEYAPTHDRRMQWWREARFGMFIHWGVYSVPAGVWKGEKSKRAGEWLMLDFKIPAAEYAALASQFNPVKFNADEWVKLAKDAGMKYIVITSKHHDGFAMFHSSASPYNIYDATPFKRDPLKELAEACKKEGMKLGFYYSEAQDWHHPGGAAYKGKINTDKNIDKENHWDTAQQGSMDEYIDKIAVPQVKEILSNYGPVAILWWDTPGNMTPQRVMKFLPLLKLQPDIVVNNRLYGKKYTGDFETPEQKIPATGIPGKDWETCMTMNTTWGYKSFDDKWKSSETLIRNLVDIASKGGNYLLNVGPTSEGLIPEPSVERLHEIGRWMKVNGEAVYGTTASPFTYLPWGRCTKKLTADGATLYLHVFQWPADGKLLVPGLKNTLESASLLIDGSKLEAADDKGGVVVSVPAAAPDKISSTVVLKVKGALKVE